MPARAPTEPGYHGELTPGERRRLVRNITGVSSVMGKRTAPDPIEPCTEIKWSALGGLTEGRYGEPPIREGRERDQSRRAGDVRDDEEGEVVEHGSGDQLPEGTMVAIVGLLRPRQIPVALLLVDDYRRIAKPDKDEVQREPAGAAVALDERAHLLELRVQPGELLGQWAARSSPALTASPVRTTSSTQAESSHR